MIPYARLSLVKFEQDIKFIGVKLIQSSMRIKKKFIFFKLHKESIFCFIDYIKRKFK